VKKTSVYAFAAVLIVAIGFAVSAGNATLSIGFHCDAELLNGDLGFDSDAQAPGANSSEGECGMFWSHEMYMTLHANANAIWSVQCTNFKHQENSLWQLDSSLNESCVQQHAGWGMVWLLLQPPYGTMVAPGLQIGVERKGYADHAGTYISTITITCIEH